MPQPKRFAPYTLRLWKEYLFLAKEFPENVRRRQVFQARQWVNERRDQDEQAAIRPGLRYKIKELRGFHQFAKYRAMRGRYVEKK